jgi:hypothetical protein
MMQAADKAFGHGPATFAEGQANGEVVPGDPHRLSRVAIAALQGFIAISTNGKFKKGIDLATLTEDAIERMIVGFRPRK